ncbi:glycoside hydrolase superfamily [Sphaerosporella brunnea]|uniref:Glycoside hydrolase superfamily n=1 Tax=Sphaerosporella brunnea TaxID=1250544 RepID=A0A5J5F2D6_9PEZI|nr:glycoside hydrolase superfamily [Sphaerosporella brunnea]
MITPVIMRRRRSDSATKRKQQQQQHQTASTQRNRKTITKALSSSAIAVLLLASVLLPIAAAETTFRNCTYNGRFNYANSLVSISDIVHLDGSVSWGVSLDSASMSIDDYVNALGVTRAPVIINIYFDIEQINIVNNPLNCQIAAARAAGAILMLTVEPWGGLNVVNSTATTQLGQLCRDINDAGMPVLVRFAHEMNGDWYPWGQRPGEYRDAFRAVASAVKAAAPNSAMVWAPNTGVGYPYAGAGKYYPTDTKSSAFSQMDTNQDGRIDEKDDPFTPYYPGDDVVDWIGVSLYSKRDNGRADQYANILSDRSSVKKYITSPNTNFNLYQKFAEAKNKPFMIAETAAAYYPNFPKGNGEVALKQNWWRQFWSADALNTFPLLKAAVWFELKKVADTGEVRDYCISKNRDVLNAFISDVSSTDGVNFLNTQTNKLTGGNGGCACTKPGDRNGNGKPDKNGGVALGVGRASVMLVMCALGLTFGFGW